MPENLFAKAANLNETSADSIGKYIYFKLNPKSQEEKEREWQQHLIKSHHGSPLVTWLPGYLFYKARQEIRKGDLSKSDTVASYIGQFLVKL